MLDELLDERRTRVPEDPSRISNMYVITRDIRARGGTDGSWSVIVVVRGAQRAPQLRVVRAPLAPGDEVVQLYEHFNITRHV